MNKEIRRAEERVDISISEFETAMNHLERKVQEGTEKIQKVVKAAHKPKEIARRAVDQTKAGVFPYFREAMVFAREISDGIQRNPQPYLIAASAMVGALLTMWLKTDTEIQFRRFRR
jgi:hypothetical protein